MMSNLVYAPTQLFVLAELRRTWDRVYVSRNVTSEKGADAVPDTIQGAHRCFYKIHQGSIRARPQCWAARPVRDD